MSSFILASQIYLPNIFLLLSHKTSTAYINAKNTLSLRRVEILKMLVKKDSISWKEEIKTIFSTGSETFVCLFHVSDN